MLFKFTDAFLFTGIVDSAGDRDGIPEGNSRSNGCRCLVIS